MLCKGENSIVVLLAPYFIIMKQMSDVKLGDINLAEMSNVKLGDNNLAELKKWELKCLR